MKQLTLVFCVLASLFVFTFNLLAAAEQAVEKKVQTLCPVMGEKIDKQEYTDYKGFRIYFCCGSCKAKFTKDPEKYMKNIMDQGIELEKTPVLKQTPKTEELEKTPVLKQTPKTVEAQTQPPAQTSDEEKPKAEQDSKTKPKESGVTGH